MKKITEKKCRIKLFFQHAIDLLLRSPECFWTLTNKICGEIKTHMYVVLVKT